jgi:isoleucyl-tRNA synthetase
MLTHGFFIDEDGRKMSKSLGNTIEPQDIIKESGADVLRLWVSSVDYREEMRISKEILARVVEAYRKIRNTARILVGNLYDFDPTRDMVPVNALEPVDRYALGRYAETALKVERAYEAYEFQAIYHAINALATVDLSAFYVDVSKDRLYTLAPSSPSRRSAQTTMYLIVDGLARLLAPVLPVTADELWSVLPGTREASIHLSEFPSPESLDAMLEPSAAGDWQRLLAIRDVVNAALERERKVTKTIGNSLMAALRIRASGSDLDVLRRFEPSLPTIFIVSDVALESGATTATQPGQADAPAVQVEVSRSTGTKCERCWRYVPSVSREAAHEGLCDRCVAALAERVQS